MVREVILNDWKNDWTSIVQKGDYILVESISNLLDSKLVKVSKVTSRSIYINGISFSKRYKKQWDGNLIIKPFLASHVIFSNK